MRKRRGVTPFVTLRKRCGYISAKSRSTVWRKRSECNAATPLTACAPIVARCAMRTFLSPRSSISDMRVARASSAGKARRTLVEKTVIDFINDFELARQQALKERQTPRFKRLGQQRVIGVCKSALGDIPRRHPRKVRARPGRRRINSATAIDGWVPLSCGGKQVGKVFDRCVLDAAGRKHILQRTRNKKFFFILLRQAAGCLPASGSFVRIEQPWTAFRGNHLLLHSPRSSRRR